MKKFSILLLFTFLFLGCEDFLDVNESLDNDERTTPNYMLPSVVSGMAYSHYAQGETAAYFTQYITTEFGGNAIRDRWDYRNVLRVGLWRRNYFDVAGNANKMIEFAKEEDSKNYIGVGKIMMAFSFLTTTNFFGDMPIKEAFTGIYNPTYDTQDVVYAEVETWLKEGLEALEQSNELTDREMGTTEDHLFGGDLEKWKSFANAILARLKLHTADFQSSYDEVLEYVDAAHVGWQEPLFAYPSDADSDWHRNLWGPSRPSPQWDFAEIRNLLNSSVHTDFFMNAMTLSGEHDPRLYQLTTPGENENYLSVPASQGIGALEIEDFAILYDGYWTRDDSPIVFITDEELYFIEAEAAFHNNDNERAYQAYIAGISSNFERLGIAQGLNDYLSSSAVAQSSGDLDIADIMMQKYMALYLQPETWTDMRRYKYADNVYLELQYPENVLDIYEGEWIQRIPYDPQTEYIYNPNEIERLGARDDRWILTPLWWAANSNL